MILLDEEVALSYRMRSGIHGFSKSFRHKEVHEITLSVVVTSKELHDLLERRNICVHLPNGSTVRSLGWQFVHDTFVEAPEQLVERSLFDLLPSYQAVLASGTGIDENAGTPQQPRNQGVVDRHGYANPIFKSQLEASEAAKH